MNTSSAKVNIFDFLGGGDCRRGSFSGSSGGCGSFIYRLPQCGKA